MLKVFDKLIDKNPNIDYCIGTIINEYDIKRAHPTACYFIFGKEMYDKLINMNKLDCNILIGKMMKEDKTLYPKIEKQMLRFMNMFCEANNIDEKNFVSSTRDSMVLVNKKPIKTEFENGYLRFVNKEGEYTSYIRIDNLEILFDSMSGNLRIKGIDEEYVKANQPFIRLFKQMLMILESSKTTPMPVCMRKIQQIREKYLNSKDPRMYACLTRNNRYEYIIDGEKVESEAYLEEKDGIQLIKHSNYINLIMPLIKIYFRPH